MKSIFYIYLGKHQSKGQQITSMCRTLLNILIHKIFIKVAIIHEYMPTSVKPYYSKDLSHLTKLYFKDIQFVLFRICFPKYL